jgi:DNA polymerase III epsilon subunit family exonuclease
MTLTIFDRSLMQLDIAVVDIETTGLKPDTDKILQIACVQLKNGAMTGLQQEWKINPGPATIISPEIIKLTGLSEDELRGSPSIPYVYPQFKGAIGNAIVAGHNVQRFDLQFLQVAEARHNLPVVTKNYSIDTLLLAKRLRPNQKNHKLATCAQAYGLAFNPGALHDALADTMLCARLLLHQIEELHKIGVITFRDLARFLRRTSPYRQRVGPRF